MPVEPCAKDCGRLISISLHEGGSPVALANPDQYSVEYMVCRDCGIYLCDRCWQKECPKCGKIMTPGDSMAEAEARMEAAGGVMDDYLNQDVMAGMRESALEMIRAVGEIPKEQAISLMEPGSIDWVSNFTPLFLDDMYADFQEAGIEIHPTKLLEMIDEVILRGFLLLGVCGMHRRERPLGIQRETIQSWMGIQTDIRQKARLTKGADYAGVLFGLFEESPVLQTASEMLCEYGMAQLGLSSEEPGEKVASKLAILSLVGLDLACGQLMAQEEVDPCSYRDDPHPAEYFFSHMVSACEILDDGTAEYFDPIRMEAYMSKREQTPEISIIHRARYCRMILAHSCGVDNGLAGISDLKQANIYLAARMFEQAHFHYGQAAKAGDGGAMYALAIMSELGAGCEQNSDLFMEWVRKAADAGHTGALADCYDDGIGEKKSKRKYFELAEQSARQGDTFAQGGLGLTYMKEETFDQEKAIYWINKSNENGNPIASIIINNMMEQAGEFGD